MCVATHGAQLHLYGGDSIYCRHVANSAKTSNQIFTVSCNRNSIYSEQERMSLNFNILCEMLNRECCAHEDVRENDTFNFYGRKLVLLILENKLDGFPRLQVAESWHSWCRSSYWHRLQNAVNI